MALAVLFATFGDALQADDDFAPKTIPFRAGAALIQYTVASPHAFKLHVILSVAANPKLSGPDATIYLGAKPTGPAPGASAWSDPSGKAGLKLSSGEMQVDEQSGKWRLLDAGGKVLADWALISSGSGPGVNIALGPSLNQPHPLYYGSGNEPDTGALAQVQSGARMSNGRATLPQFWSSAGYGVLVVGEYGDHPASWKSRADGGVDLTIPGTSADIYVMPVPTLYDWLRDDAELTGFAPVPPRWAFGYLQSRWGWTDQKYIDDTLAHFRQDELPVDAFIFDFEWYTKAPDYGVPPEGDPKFVDFGWNALLFPDPAAQIAGWLKQGLHVIGIRKPRLGNSDALAMARKKGWINAGDLNDHYEGKTRFRNIDFSQPDARAYWEKNNRKFLEAGMAGFWNDEGETTYTKYSYWNLAETDLVKQVNPEARFFTLNRSFIPGLQRFGVAVWTGDIAGDWKTLARTPGELLSFSLAGMPYSTCDIGGFHKNASPELLARWMEAGVFFPVMRSHSTREDTPHFPWLYGADAEAAIRRALDLRYRLVPYYYSLAHEAEQTGAPLMRPLVMEFPGDSDAAKLTDEWLMGRGLLAAPILDPGGTRTVHLPKDTWYEFESGHVSQGPADVNFTGAALDFIPIYVRAGTLLPLGPVVQYTGQASSEPMELRIYPGRDATFTLVEDDGETKEYQKGAERETTFTWDDQKRQLSWKVTGAYSGANVFTAMKAKLFEGAQPKEQAGTLGQDGMMGF